jgi:pantoate--beta-alanine ligase
MEIIRMPRVMQGISRDYMLNGKTVGFVATMGAIHDGHLSLLKRAKLENDITVVSVFVNPIQFGPAEDFKRYPRDIEGDTEKLQREGADIIFTPEISSMYPEGFLTHVDVVEISEKLCGAFRPGHFRGVATVVTKLLNIIKPTRAYFGQKDYQQTVIIKNVVTDLDMDVDIIMCPTIRERDGLALSSRNAYLDERQRKASTVLYTCLIEASELIKSGIMDAIHITGVMRERLLYESAVSAVEYCGVYDTHSLEEQAEIKGDVLLAVAVQMGNTRLIDNVLANLTQER